MFQNILHLFFIMHLLFFFCVEGNYRGDGGKLILKEFYVSEHSACLIFVMQHIFFFEGSNWDGRGDKMR